MITRDNKKKKSLTVLLSAGRLPLEILKGVHTLAEEYGLTVYLSTLQNIRLTDIDPAVEPDVRARLRAAGASFKRPGMFPVPRVCVGKNHCNLGIIDTEDVSKVILERFRSKKQTKPKFKIAISACTLCCSGPMTSDIGIVATRKGLNVYVGGKGGSHPLVARRIARDLTVDDVVDLLEELVAYHDQKTKKKQRFYKLLEEPDFIWKEV